MTAAKVLLERHATEQSAGQQPRWTRTFSIRFPEQLRQPRNVDGDAPLLVARFNLKGLQTPSVKKYVVRLSAEEREQLQALIRKGKSPAKRLLKARILLKADVSEAGEGWSDSRIIEALETSTSMVYRVRKQLVEEGFEAVLSRKPRAMEDVLAVYTRPRDPDCPLVCLDETSKQLIAETRVPVPMKSGRPARHDYEYERNGTANLFMMFAPPAGATSRSPIATRRLTTPMS
jgi:hypothetical protein